MIAGRIGDRFGLARVIWVSSILYGLGLIGGGIAQQWHYWYLGLVFVVSIAAGAVMTLAWGLLFKLMPSRDRGAIAGLATTTKGFGLLIGVPLTGLAIDLVPTRTCPRRRGSRRSGHFSASRSSRSSRS